jgi:hypothetical protein
MEYLQITYFRKYTCQDFQSFRPFEILATGNVVTHNPC